jgi:hypothetical protein
MHVLIASWNYKPSLKILIKHARKFSRHWDDFLQSKWITDVFQYLASQLKWPNPGRWLTENSQILEDDLPRLAKSQLPTSRNRPGPCNINYCDLVSPASQFAKYQNSVWWNRQPKAIFWGLVILGCRKPELTGVFKLTFWGLKNADKSHWLDKAIPEILKPH